MPQPFLNAQFNTKQRASIVNKTNYLSENLKQQNAEMQEKKNIKK